MGGTQSQRGKMMGLEDFGAAPNSLMLPSFLRADPLGLFLSFVFFLPVRAQAQARCLDSPFPGAELKCYVPLKALGSS